jgi:hypothetical protein
MKSKLVLAFVAALLALLSIAPSASAFKVLSEAGEGAGQTAEAGGLGLDRASGRLYVAERANNRVSVFGPTGAFEEAFGWGVKTGSNAFEVCTTKCRKGLAGAGNGQFDGPEGLAVDNDPASPSFHDVYVVDFRNLRVQRFDPDGNFVLAFGGGVDQVTSGDVCTAASVCGKGTAGGAEGEFSDRGTLSMDIAPGGTVYVLDSYGTEDLRLQKFDPSGTVIAPQLLLPEPNLGENFQRNPLAVDSTGAFYVSLAVDNKGAGKGASINKYSSVGAKIGEIDAEDSGIDLGIGATLAVDDEDNLFAGSYGGGPEVSIVEFNPAGNPLRRFGYGSFKTALLRGDLAPYHSATGDIYASEPENLSTGSRVLHLDFPPASPLVFPEPCKATSIGNAKATLNAGVNPEGKATTFHFEYVDAEHFENDGGFASPATKVGAESGSIGSDFVLHKASAEVDVIPETEYRCRVVAANADAPAGVSGETGTFTSLPPFEILSTWARGVGTEAATLGATVNPLGIPASGHFEYVEEATFEEDVALSGPGHGFDHAVRVPDTGAGEEALDFGTGNSPQERTASVSDLSPGTAYRYRVLVTDLKISPKAVPGPVESLRTFDPGAGGKLPDDRAYELVSPPQKNSAEVGVPGPAGGANAFLSYQKIQASSGSGEAVTYTSWTSFAGPVGAPAASQYLSKRTASGWGTANISPFGSQRIIVPPYRGFSSELDFGAFVSSEPPLTPDAPAGIDNLYLRNNQSGALQALTNQAPVIDGPELCLDFAGVSEDGSRAFFAANGAYAGAPEGKIVGVPEFSLYEWSAAEGLRPVSVLPGKSIAAVPAEATAFGAAAVNGGHCQTAETISRHVVSADGRTAFWTYAPASGTSKLLARINGEETIQLDAKETGANAGVGPSGDGRFWAAGFDGSVAFFSAPGRLTKDAKAEGHLYRYDTVARALTDLTPGEVAPQVQGVAGASDDGTYLYFVAKGALTGSEENAAHQKAVADANNLYLWHQGEGLRFIAILGDLKVDPSAWSSNPARLGARVSPDGRHLAFLSTEAQELAGYDNTVAAGGHCELPEIPSSPLLGSPLCAQAFLYDAEVQKLTCASCNPSGARPLGPSTLPGWTNAFEGPRYLSEDGSRLYFQSFDALSFADENGEPDVYEFERPGAGSCSTQIPEFDPVSGGCHFLISNGKSSDETFLIDASLSGRDVFFATRSPLVGWDENENYDVYDAREGGGFPEPTQQPSCLGEACKAPAGAAPGAAVPATPSFQGPGNVVEKQKKQKKKKHKSKKRQARANHKGRAGR